MKVEMPELRRCCCCLPLRRGLLAWGYFKLLLSLPIYIFTMFLALGIYSFFFTFYHNRHVEIFITTNSTVFLILDISFTIVFLVAAHQKSAKLLRIFYIFSIVTTCLGATCLILFVALFISIINDHKSLEYRIHSIMVPIALVLLFIGSQTYFILLVRSEIHKLANNNCNIRFYNNTIDGKCTLENGTSLDQGKGVADHKIDQDDHDSVDMITDEPKNNFKYNKF